MVTEWQIFPIFAHYSEVAMIKDFFEMTRHERRGAIVVLVTIALLLAATCFTRCHRRADVPQQADVIRQFEAELDSSTMDVSKPLPEKAASPEGKHHKASPKRSKPAHSPKPSPSSRPMEPVPQI